MKKYKLKRWYPSLQKKTIEGNIANWDFDERAYTVTQNGDRVEILDKSEVENNPDFWEEVEQPLFVTDDDIEIFDDTTEIISVSIKHHTVSKWGYRYLCKPLDCENFKHFGIEANADKYIEDNKPKPIFTTEDGVKIFDFELERCYYVTDKLEKINLFINWFTIESMAKDTKIFKHESNADEYIWRNKWVFNYEDMMKAKNSIILTNEDIEKAAKERSKQ